LQEAEDVREIFKIYCEHRTLNRTILALETKGIKSKARPSARDRLVKTGRWTVDSLSFILQNPAYIGKKEVNKSMKDKDQGRLKPWQRYAVVDAAWPAIVDDEIYFNVQNIIEDNKARERSRLHGTKSRIFLASGLLKCGQCAGTLVGSSAHGRNKVHRYYVHSAKKGDVISCIQKRYSANEIENGIGEHLSEILLRAGHFDKIGETIRKSIKIKPEDLKRKKAHLSGELEKVTLGIQRTFKIQAEMDADSEGIKLVAQALQELGRKKKIFLDEIEQLKTAEGLESDLNVAVDDLKDRLEAFKRGWKKASAMNKKALLKNLLWGIVVTPTGLEIEYRLKDGLNSTGFLDSKCASFKTDTTIFDLNDYSHLRPPPASASSEVDNREIQKLQVVGNGSESRT
jgi:hypothetical protein